jgi:TRAP transporter TAXI family solute receptor
MRRLISLLALMVSALVAQPAMAQEKVNLFIATGPTSGVYYPLGGGMADLLTRYVPNLNVTAGTTAGSIANLQLMQGKRADVALSMADASWDAFKGQQKFQGKPVEVRALMVLYPNRMHVVTVEGTGISKFSDLKGKRVSTGAVNSATEVMALRLMEAQGLTLKDIQQERLDPGKSADAIKDKKLDAFFWVGGVPTAGVTELAATPGIKIKMIDHDDGVAGMVKVYGPLYVKDVIPAKTYPGMDQPNRIATVWNVLVARADLPDQLAYDIVKTMFERKEDMIRVHKESQNFDYKYQTNATAVIPFHPGAVKYFAEKGVKLQ